MFETMSLETLQQYWWIIISLLGALLVFLMFVQGGQTLLYAIGKTETEQKLIVNSLGVYFYYTGHLWRCLFRLFPALLQHELWRCILGMDGYPVCLHHSGRIV